MNEVWHFAGLGVALRYFIKIDWGLLGFSTASTTKLCGANKAQRSLRLNERFVIRFVPQL